MSCDEVIERQLDSMFSLVAELLSGHVLEGRYLLERLVRSDPIGSLYDARDLEQRVPVAVRVLRALRPAGARAAAPPSQHANAVEVLAVGVTDLGLPYSVIEPLSGEAVSDRVQRGKVIAVGEALQWGVAVAEALTDAHAHGEVHGRLCASSVFLDRADTAAQSVKVLDFEVDALVPLAAVTAGALSSQLGSFCAPELRARVAPTAASDVFALAVVLGVLFAGAMPPEPGTEPSLREWVEQVLPAELAGLAVRALDDDPAARPSARSLARAIGRLATARVYS